MVGRPNLNEASRHTGPERENDWRGFDFWADAEHQRDPYSNYAKLRQCDTVPWSDQFGGYWMLSKWRDIERVLRDQPTFSSAKMTLPERAEPDGPRIPLTLDPPEHAVYRSMLQPMFTTATAREMESTAREIAGQLLDQMDPSGPVDIEQAFTIPFPQRVLLTWLGVPDSAFDMLLELDKPIRAANHDDSQQPAAYQARIAASEYFTNLVAERKASGPIGPDLLSFLITAQIEGRPLTLNETQRILMLMYSAGFHTTSATITNLIWYLAGHHDLRDRLNDDPQLLTVTVEELMRSESLAALRRTATEDVELNGCLIKAGDPVILFLGSAGRDEEVHSEADVVDVDRQSHRHLNFGAGAHRCLGSHFARMEIRVAVSSLHARFPNYSLANESEVRHHSAIERAHSNVWVDLGVTS